MVVRSDVYYGTVVLNTSKGAREFEVGLLRKFHGDPCEIESRLHGGDCYPRRRI